MRVLIFTHEFPYPPNNGGRVDILNRLKALKLQGHHIFLVAWSIYEDNQDQKNIEHVAEFVDELVVYKRNNSFLHRFANIANKLRLLPIQPNIVTDCQLSNSEENKLLYKISLFKPQFIMADAIFAGKTAYKFSIKLQIPFFIRSHNIEHLYVKKQLSNATNIKSFFKLFGSYASLMRYETNILAKANAVLDISLNDAAFWENKGLKNVYWSPPVFFKYQTNNSNQPKLFDITYVGNLYNPNNLGAIYWFLTDVLPLIQKNIPDIKVCIAGSKPTNELIENCKKYKSVTINANPVDIASCYWQSKIMINPTQFGSGVNLKTIEQLFEDVPVVCTSVALAGLPQDFHSIYNVADTPEDFAACIVKLLNNEADSDDMNHKVVKEKLRALFSAESYCKLLEKILQ